MITILNVAVAGLLAGIVAAAAVELLAVRWPRIAALAGTFFFPLVALAPFTGRSREVAIPLDHRSLDALATALCWLVAAALAAREITGHIRGARQRHHWTQAPAELRRSIGVDAIYIDPSEPAATHGIFRRAIVVPSAETAREVLLHERAHFVWRDPSLTAFRRFIRAALWFHPGLSLLERSVRQASELAADADAMRVTGPQERVAFATLLVTSARSTAVAFGAPNASELEVRVHALLGTGNRGRAAVRALIVIAALALFPLVPRFAGHDSVVVRRVIQIR